MAAYLVRAALGRRLWPAEPSAVLQVALVDGLRGPKDRGALHLRDNGPTAGLPGPVLDSERCLGVAEKYARGDCTPRGVNENWRMARAAARGVSAKAAPRCSERQSATSAASSSAAAVSSPAPYTKGISKSIIPHLC